MALLAVTALAAGCVSVGGVGPTSPTQVAAPDPGDTDRGDEDSADEGGRCPAQRAEPAAERPQIELDFELSSDGRSVAGTERVEFTPDIATDRLVFRLTANQPSSAAAGTGIEVGEVLGKDVASVEFESAGSARDSQGGLLVVDLDQRLEPGDSTEVTIDFVLHLGSDTFDRFGSDDRVSWWGSGHPLLAWEPGVGWSDRPLVSTMGETAASPAADTTVSVRAPAGRRVVMTGGAELVDTGGGSSLWRSREAAARDVAVAVGYLEVAQGLQGDTRLTVGAPTREAAEELLTRVGSAVDELSAYFGPYPYPTLSMARLEDYGGGVEYPSMILLADPSDLVLVHEVAHMWFYGMVGGDQGRDPWLDESFATYAEQLVRGLPADTSGAEDALSLSVDVGMPIGDFTGAEQYFATVYDKGAAMLVVARARAGAGPFDAALRCYVEANAWQIATPQDVRDALAGLPDAVSVLEEAGALPS